MFYQLDSMCYFKPVRIVGDYAYDSAGQEYQIHEYIGISYVIRGEDQQSWIIEHDYYTDKEETTE